MTFIPNTKLLARAFHRVSTAANATRGISTSLPRMAETGDKSNKHANMVSEPNNVQHDAAKAGKAERASGEGSGATSEKDETNQNAKAKRDHPEAPGPVIGMNDERGGKGHTS